MSSSNNNSRSQIFLIAVVRFSDKTVIATLSKTKDVTVEGVRECIASNGNIVTGKRYTTKGENYSIHYTQDAQGRVYSLVTTLSYSPRIAFTAIDELIHNYGKELGPRSASATENSLSKVAKPILDNIIEKFGDPASVDKLSAVQEKIDIVQMTMKENIQQILQNDEKIQRIDAAALHLNEQSLQFRDNSKSLAQKMLWKKWKMRLLIGGLIIAVLVIIIVPIAVSSSKK
eukprot:gene22908-29674_t